MAGRSKGAATTGTPTKLNLGAEKLMSEEQRHRFDDAAKASGGSEDEAEFAAAMKFAKLMRQAR